jgi:hypothetical protein
VSSKIPQAPSLRCFNAVRNEQDDLETTEDTKRPGAATKASYRSNTIGSLPLVAGFLLEKRVFSNLYYKGIQKTDLPREERG